MRASGRENPGAPSEPSLERRRARRLHLHLQVLLALPPVAPSRVGRILAAELLDVSEDGRGAALLLSTSRSVPLGGRVKLRLSNDGEDVGATVVSRLGSAGRCRVGLRIDLQCQERLRQLAAAAD